MLCSKNGSPSGWQSNLNRNSNDNSTSIPVLNAPHHLSKHVILAENNLTTFNQKANSANQHKFQAQSAG